MWITGLPASGKSTLGAALEERLVNAGIGALRLDGDNLRHGLTGDLGFGRRDRAENVRRTAYAARLLAESATIAIVTLVSPYGRDRAAARDIHDADDLQFVEVFVDTPIEECERRDPKQLYRRARAGELSGVTGVDDPYEPPASPDIRVTEPDLSTNIDLVCDELLRRGLLSAFPEPLLAHTSSSSGAH